MKKLHIQEVGLVVDAWDNGTPLKALCGYTRVSTEADYVAIRETAPTCKVCDRILRGLLTRGRALSYPNRETADDLRKRARREQWWFTVRIQAPGNDTWAFPLAG